MQSLWMLFASFMFAFMGVCVKLASTYYSTSEIIMYRGMIGMVFLAILVKVRGGTFRTPLPWHHLRRGAIGVTALWLWFYSISALPLATAMTLNYMSPIWMAAMLFAAGWWRGAKRFEWGLVAAISMSFVGVTMLLQPSFQSDKWFPAIVALGSGMLAALAYLQVRALGHLGEPEYRVVFYFSATSAVGGMLTAWITPNFIGATASASAWHAHSAKGVALLVAVGLCATIAQMAMTRAYRLGKALVTANLQYTGIVFSTVWGILIWSDTLSWLAWSGILVILGSGMASTIYNHRNAISKTVVVEETGDTDPIAAET
jgi:S-adenosylmethionine uptake transporter